MTQTQPMTTKEVAKTLGVSVSYVSKLVKRGRLAPTYQAPGVRGALFFDPKEIDYYQATVELQTAGKAK